MEQDLKVRVEQFYGTTRVYPVCEKAKALADLLGTKTFTLRQLNGAKALGFKFVPVVNQAQNALAGVLEG